MVDDVYKVNEEVINKTMGYRRNGTAGRGTAQPSKEVAHQDDQAHFYSFLEKNFFRDRMNNVLFDLGRTYFYITSRLFIIFYLNCDILDAPFLFLFQLGCLSQSPTSNMFVLFCLILSDLD